MRLAIYEFAEGVLVQMTLTERNGGAEALLFDGANHKCVVHVGADRDSIPGADRVVDTVSTPGA